MAENGDVNFAPKAIGIDLGTTYSCIGIWRNNEREVEIIRNEQGNRTTPCMVAFLAEENLVGQSAMNQVFHNPHNTVFDVKRLIGRRYSDELVQKNKSLWPFKVVSGPRDEPLIEIRYQGSKKTFRPEEISSMLLKELKRSAEEFLECAVNKAVITVPAYFSNSQRQATRDAGNLAGLDVLQLLNEPTAAAIAYSIISRSQVQTHIPNEKILVYDLGGGTFDIAVLEIMNAQKEIAVKAVKGDTHLGGQDFDNRLLEFLLAEFQSKNNVNISGNAKASRRLRSACERAKRELSHARSSTIDIPCLYQSIDFFYTISRTKFEELNIDLFQRTIDLVADCIQDANLDETQIDSVVLVGGSSRIPKLEQLLKDFFAKNQSVKIHKHINPDEAVAYGAAVKAAQLNGDILDLDLDLCEDPCWAAICSSRDVTPLSLGIMTKRDVMSVIIPRKSPIPVKRERFFRTVKDNQSSMRLDFYEGERANVKDNSFLGGFTFGGIPPQPKGVEGLFLCMEIDKDGIVRGSVKNSSTGRSRDFCFRSRFEEDFEMEVVQKAEAFRSQDEVWKEIVVLKNTIDDGIYDHRKRLDEFKGVISSREEKFQADFANELGKWVAENANADVHKLKEKLQILKANQERLSAAIKREQKKPKLFRCIRSPMH